MKKLQACLLLAAGLWSAAFAYADKPEDISADLAAITQIEAGQPDAAAELLATRNSGKKGTLEWYRQAAALLKLRGLAFESIVDHDNGRRAGNAAIKLLLHALNQQGANSRADERGQLYVELAQAYEVLVGDSGTARVCYEKAIAEAPDNPIASAALARYAEEDAKARRIQNGGQSS